MPSSHTYAVEVGSISHRAGGQHKYHYTIKQWKNTINQTVISSLRPGLYGDDPLATVRLPRGVFLANYLASTDNLTRIIKDRRHTNENWQYINGP